MSVLADFHPLPGEALHRRARRWALAALIAVVVTLPCIIFIKPLWSQLITLGSGTFMLAAGALALVMLAGPLIALGCLLVALWLRIEACFSLRHHRRRGGDMLAIGGGLLTSFAPALLALVPPLRGLLTGHIAWRGFGPLIALGSHPQAFWQAVAAWLLGAAILAALALRYWRNKWRSRAGILSARAAVIPAPEEPPVALPPAPTNSPSPEDSPGASR